MKWEKIQGNKQLIFFLALCFFGALAYNAVQKNYSQHKSSTVRPEDFPAILTAPATANQIVFEGPSTTLANVYSIIYQVSDSFPPTKTIDFIHNKLLSNGWQRLDFSVLNPHVPTTVEWQLEKTHKSLSEDWVDTNDQIIVVILACGLEHKDPNRTYNICVNMFLYEVGSWPSPYLERYKKIHTDEFMKKNLGPPTQ